MAGAGRKSRWLSVCIVGILLVALVPLQAFAAPSSSNGSRNSSNTLQYIGEAKAKTIALEHARVAEADATFIKVHLEREHGKMVYDVEFYSGNTEYDYEIDALNGKILEHDREIEHYRIPKKPTQSSKPTSAPAPAKSTTQYIGKEKAAVIALAEAGLSESQVRKLKVDLDRERGKMVYEVEFKSGRMEYEYDIDATNGKMLKSDIEYDD